MSRHLKKSSQKRRRNSKATYLEILQDINCIPAGVYKLDSQENNAREFSLQDEVFFVIMNANDSLFHEIPNKEFKQRATVIEDFLDRYYDLLEKSRSKPWKSFNPFQPFTACFLPPAFMRELN